MNHKNVTAIPVSQERIDDAVAKAKEYMASKDHDKFAIGTGMQLAIKLLRLWPEEENTK